MTIVLSNRQKYFLGIVMLMAAAGLMAIGCGPALAPSKPLNELTPDEVRGRQIFASQCARCHYANSDSALHGPGLFGLFRRKYLSSGAPANDDRVTDAILHGRGMMPAMGNSMDDEQLQELLAYLHTL
ncbi:MAG TPA: cytochrome c [Alloacidobacterium sp.]|nr:cytochrome c [Alloacidobacterium sp.]